MTQEIITVSFIKTIFDLLSRLFSDRRENRRAIIRDIVDPLYEKSCALAQSYFEILSLAQYDSNLSDKKELDALIKKLRDIRKSYLAERQTIQSMGKIALEKWEDEDFKNFAESVCKLFSFTESIVYFPDNYIREASEKYRRTGSPGSCAIDILERFRDGELDYFQTINVISNGMVTFQQMWLELSLMYATIKIPEYKDLLKMQRS